MPISRSSAGFSSAEAYREVAFASIFIFRPGKIYLRTKLLSRPRERFYISPADKFIFAGSFIPSGGTFYISPADKFIFAPSFIPAHEVASVDSLCLPADERISARKFGRDRLSANARIEIANYPEKAEAQPRAVHELPSTLKLKTTLTKLKFVCHGDHPRLRGAYV